MHNPHQAQPGLTLLVGENKTGYLGVRHEPKSKINRAQMRRSGKVVSLRCNGQRVTLGFFANAEEAALCVARPPEGQAAAQWAAAAPVPLTSEEARQQAQAEGLTLSLADSPVGYFGVHHKPGRAKPYLAQVRRGGTTVHLGSFATAEEAALCIARSPEGRAVAAAAAERAAAPPPLTSEEVRQQAQAEGLTLLVAKNTTGYFGVNLTHPGRPRPYQAYVRRGGKQVSLGYFATAEEAALCVARSPEGQAAAERVVSAPPPRSEEESQGTPLAMPSRAVLKEAGTVPPLPPGAFIKEEEVVPLMQLLDAVVKREHAFVADEGGRSEGRPKRQRN